MKLALCIRGHIRDGLIDSNLAQFIDFLQNQNFSVDLYLHTWKESEAKSSYRDMDRSHVFTVSRNFLKFYFKNYNVKTVVIEDDSKIQLVGKTEGKVCLSACPLIAWKRMWAGKYRLIQEVNKAKVDYDCVINTRYDIFTNNLCKISRQKIYRLIHQPGDLKFVYPTYKNTVVGVDNIYCGQLSYMTSLITDFHHNLDEIMFRYPNTFFQEEMVYRYSIDHAYTQK